MRRATQGVDGSGKRSTSFLSTLSLRRATPPRLKTDTSGISFLSTLSLRRATAADGVGSECRTYFYPRSPCGERLQSTHSCDLSIRFLSTLSLRRATGAPVDRMPSSSISIHALLAESDLHNGGPWQAGYTISIHALLAESDCPLFFSCWVLAYFYPRSPCGERPRVARTPTTVVTISIHALLAESDVGGGGRF